MIAGSSGAESDGHSQAAHVEFEGVSKSYDGRTLVVDDLNLGIDKGEFVTLLGPSGSGKTTILMMLAGFQTATSGAIRIGGRSVQDLPPRKRGIGMVFQNYALFPHMTVGANLAFPLEVRGIAEARRRERVERALDLVRLGGLEDRRPGQLSGGQQQRVAIARALVFEPELVLMDEPLGALDRSLREEMQYEIRSIHQRLGVTVVYVTHDQQEAMVMSDRIAVLNGGRIEQIAGAEGLYEEPERAFVARFIGENNRLHGRVTLVKDDLCEVDVGGERIRAFRIAPCGVGDTVTLSIRPERIAIKPDEGLYHNVVEAAIEDMTFLGDHLRVRLTACGGRDVVAKIPNIVGHGAMMVGDAVRIGWTVNDCRALDFEGDGENRT
ncbi:MAG: ABC transporter ATP-binding protein [Gemmatimonadales bacterium]|nr:ABC transporter ATP-binding protein [Gemmatimonadales bacterium]MYG48166.1 ABC transporter ATP-binding protein [Gemmatimonadales bacterium]MYK01936.1 ABC transporter ATP-binding protein [Candidatus Palauibacter ramosifaciens]